MLTFSIVYGALFLYISIIYMQVKIFNFILLKIMNIINVMTINSVTMLLKRFYVNKRGGHPSIVLIVSRRFIKARESIFCRNQPEHCLLKITCIREKKEE